MQIGDPSDFSVLEQTGPQRPVGQFLCAQLMAVVALTTIGLTQCIAPSQASTVLGQGLAQFKVTKKGDKVEVDTPGGLVKYTILDVK